MEKNDLVELLDELFVPLGFKRKGNSWVQNGDTLNKIVNLQKSNYGNAFYINYGYVLRSLALKTTTHVEDRLASADKIEQREITELLDLETPIPAEQRVKKLTALVIAKVVAPIMSINTEHDLLADLKRRPDLNMIPLAVRRHFNLE